MMLTLHLPRSFLLICMFATVAKIDADWGEAFLGYVSSRKIFQAGSCIHVSVLSSQRKWATLRVPCFSYWRNRRGSHASQSLRPWLQIFPSTSKG